jgi:hypothetical protein
MGLKGDNFGVNSDGFGVNSDGFGVAFTVPNDLTVTNMGLKSNACSGKVTQEFQGHLYD